MTTNEAAIDAAMDLARNTREFRAGSGFDVPGDAVESFTLGILTAVQPVIERAAVDRVLAEVEARIDTGRQSHFVEYGNDVPDARGEDWGWTHALDVVEAYRRELSGE